LGTVGTKQKSILILCISNPYGKPKKQQQYSLPTLSLPYQILLTWCQHKPLLYNLKHVYVYSVVIGQWGNSDSMWILKRWPLYNKKLPSRTYWIYSVSHNSGGGVKPKKIRVSIIWANCSNTRYSKYFMEVWKEVRMS